MTLNELLPGLLFRFVDDSNVYVKVDQFDTNGNWYIRQLGTLSSVDNSLTYFHYETTVRPRSLEIIEIRLKGEDC